MSPRGGRLQGRSAGGRGAGIRRPRRASASAGVGGVALSLAPRCRERFAARRAAACGLPRSTDSHWPGDGGSHGVGRTIAGCSRGGLAQTSDSRDTLCSRRGAFRLRLIEVQAPGGGPNRLPTAFTRHSPGGGGAGQTFNMCLPDPGSPHGGGEASQAFLTREAVTCIVRLVGLVFFLSVNMFQIFIFL